MKSFFFKVKVKISSCYINYKIKVFSTFDMFFFLEKY